MRQVCLCSGRRLLSYSGSLQSLSIHGKSLKPSVVSFDGCGPSLDIAHSQLRPCSRGFHQISCQKDQSNSPQQAHPLGDFYADLLAQPIPKPSTATTDLPTWVDTGGDTTKQERAAKLFGTIKGSGYERSISDTPDASWKTINGVPIPPRPSEPENCCMSGCVHCVWDDYRDDVEQWAVRLREAQAKGTGNSNIVPKIDMHRPEVTNASISMDDDGGGSDALWTSPSANAGEDDLFEGIPIGIREFMATEKRIKARKKRT